jgi:hypothetical protein
MKNQYLKNKNHKKNKPQLNQQIIIKIIKIQLKIKHNHLQLIYNHQKKKTPTLNKTQKKYLTKKNPSKKLKLKKPMKQK